MFGLGPTELLLIAFLALLILVPSRLPEAANALGKGVKEFKTAVKSEDDNPQENPAEK